MLFSQLHRKFVLSRYFTNYVNFWKERNDHFFIVFIRAARIRDVCSRGTCGWKLPRSEDFTGNFCERFGDETWSKLSSCVQWSHLKQIGKWSYIRRRHCKEYIFTNRRYFSTFSTPTATQKTIFALSSGQGRAGVAVIRVSGPRTMQVLKLMIQDFASMTPRKAVFIPIYDPVSREQIDHGLVLWFPGPNSFTGEDVCEFQVHGGPAVVSAMYSALGKVEGLQLAEPGEFSKRAFCNGKLDLTEVEGLGDLIHAETEAQRRQAIHQMSGDLSKLYQKWRQRLLKTVAHVEAFIDFSEDENIEDGVLENARLEVTRLLSEVRHHLADNRRGERLRSGVHVTIAGQPNVGKSTLLNTLCQRPAAIVSPVAGTTRDVVESAINIGGYPVLLSDTAGIRQSQDVVELEGIRRARERAEQADITIFMLDATEFTASDPRHIFNKVYAHLQESQLWSETFNQEDSDSVVSEDSLNAENSNKRELLVVMNKTDLLNNDLRSRLTTLVQEGALDKTQQGFNGRTEIGDTIPILLMSCKTEDGLDEFLERLKDKVKNMCSNPASSDPYLTQERHRNHLTQCAEALQSFDSREDLVMAAEELRIALRQLGKITGHVTSEEVLDVIFQDFCIGK